MSMLASWRERREAGSVRIERCEGRKRAREGGGQEGGRGRLTARRTDAADTTAADATVARTEKSMVVVIRRGIKECGVGSLES